jgi:hypothetical protein
MRYWKITNKEERHHYLQYKDGLNVDIVPFNPIGSCEPGGIYFASKDIFRFIDYGPWIREVFLPEDARVYKNPGIPEKWKADKVILGLRREWCDVEVLKELIEYGCDPTDNFVIRLAAENGHLDVVKYLHSIGCDPTGYDNLAIRWAAENGHIEVVEFLESVGCEL